MSWLVFSTLIKQCLVVELHEYRCYFQTDGKQVWEMQLLWLNCSIWTTHKTIVVVFELFLPYVWQSQISGEYVKSQLPADRHSNKTVWASCSTRYTNMNVAGSTWNTQRMHTTTSCSPTQSFEVICYLFRYLYDLRFWITVHERESKSGRQLPNVLCVYIMHYSWEFFPQKGDTRRESLSETDLINCPDEKSWDGEILWPSHGDIRLSGQQSMKRRGVQL